MKLLHTADWQLGKPFASIEDEDSQALVRKARIDALGAIGKLARAEVVDAVLVAGDLFDSPSAKASVVSAALGEIGRWPCPVYVIPGNHDHGGPGSIWAQPFFQQEREQLAPNLVLCLEAKAVITEQFVLYPCPLLRRAENADTTAWLREPEAFAENGLPRIVLAHGSILDFSRGSDDPEDEAGATNHLALDRLPMDEIDYIALGDWHGTKRVDAKTWYAGTPEYDRFPKGDGYTAGQVLIVEVGRNREPEVTVHPTGQLSWLAHEWEFHDDTDLERLSQWVQDTFASRTQADLLKLRLQGALGLEATRRLEELLTQLRARLLHLKLTQDTALAPTEEELAAFVGDAENPLIARAARSLTNHAREHPDEAARAQLALRELDLLRNRLSGAGTP